MFNVDDLLFGELGTPKLRILNKSEDTYVTPMELDLFD